MCAAWYHAQHKAGQYDTVVAELRAAKQQVLAGTAALEEVSDERDSLARQLQELREDTQREKAEAEARWKRRLEDQQARGEPSGGRVWHRVVHTRTCVCTRAVCSRCVHDRTHYHSGAGA